MKKGVDKHVILHVSLHRFEATVGLATWSDRTVYVRKF